MTILLLAAWLLPAGETDCVAVVHAAEAAYRQREYLAAARGFAQAVSVCPPNRQLRLAHAQAQLLSGQLKEALQTIEQQLAALPGDAQALKLKADVLYLLGQVSEAIEVAKNAVALDPQSIDARYALGRMLYHAGRFEESAQVFEAILRQQPGHYRAHDNLALCYQALGRDRDAERQFLQTLQLVYKDHPEYDVVYANFAEFYLQRGHSEKAFQLAAEASRRNPSNARNLYLTGKALWKLGKLEQSIRWLEQAVKLDPDYQEAWYLLAAAWRKQGDAARADAALSTFRQLSERPKARR